MEISPYLGLFLLVGLLAWGCEKTANISMPEQGICAHRGASATHPENTLTAFQEAIRLGAHMLEFDVRLTQEHELVIMHDATVDRTTSGTGKIADLTLIQIKTLDAGAWKGDAFQGERVPTFAEVLEIVPENMWLNIHIYGGRLAGEKIARIVQQQNRLHQAVLACDRQTATAARALVPEIKICNMDGQNSLDSYVQATIENRNAFIQLFRTPLEQVGTVIPEIKAANIRVNFCCTDDPVMLRGLFASGVDFTLVNDLAPMLAVAGEFGIEPLVPQFQCR